MSTGQQARLDVRARMRSVLIALGETSDAAETYTPRHSKETPCSSSS